MQLKIFNTSTPDYAKALQLRTDVLRTPLGLKFTVEELAKDVADTHLGLFINDEIIACLTLTACENNRMKMRQVAVNPVFQGKGFGKKLAEASERYAIENGREVMFCNARKTAVPFYESMGYKIVSKEFTEVGIPHFVMEKQLNKLA